MRNINSVKIYDNIKFINIIYLLNNFFLKFFKSILILILILIQIEIYYLELSHY